MNVNKKDYLGDGVYADHDGYHIILTTQEGDSISIDPDVFEALKRYEKRIRGK